MKQSYKIGDSYEFMREYPDKYFDLILTDPPYGIGESNEKNLKRGGRTNFDKKPRRKIVSATDFGHYDWDKQRIDKKYFDEMMRISKNQIIFGGNYYTDYLYPSSCWIIWDKRNGSNDFADCEIAWTSFKSAIRIFRYKWNGMLQEDMKRKEKRVHPTQKPVALFEWILKKYAKKGDLICDPFCGSGTLLAACRKTDLECVCFEKNPDYEQSIVDRGMINILPLTEHFRDTEGV